MPCLALVIELHHPLPALDSVAGSDWATAALDVYWPVLRALDRFAENPGDASLTLAVSPSWTALATDPTAEKLLKREFDRRVESETADRGLSRFFSSRWSGDPLRLLRSWNDAGVIDVIPTTATHTWLPSVASDPVVARAQVSLAAADHARRLERSPSGVWLPFLGYPPGLESVMAENGLRFFGVSADVFLRGTLSPPGKILGPMVTPPGVAAFGVGSIPTVQAFDLKSGYGRDPRYGDDAKVVRAAFEHAKHFLDKWREQAQSGEAGSGGPVEPVSLIAFSAHDLAQAWPFGGGGEWLAQVLERLTNLDGAHASSLDRYLDRCPSGPLGRPGASTGGLLAARPADSDLFERCRGATELLTFALEHRRAMGTSERRSVADMVRSLLRAQQIDWSLPYGHGVDPQIGLQRARAHVSRVHELAADLMAGRTACGKRSRTSPGPLFLPEIDLDSLAAGA